MCNIEKAQQMLDDLRAQEREYSNQLLMTRGAIQAIEHLLAISEEDDNADIPDKEANTVAG